MDLQQLFSEVMIRIGFPKAEIIKHWNDLKKAYSHKSRHYHNLTHLEEMIACYEEYKTNLQFPDEVLYAIFYHDYVYKSTKKNNELKSAEFAVQLLPSTTNLDKERVFNLIMSTKDHQYSDNPDEKWLIDFDLKILAKDWKGYELYTQQIRKEYSIYPDFMYKPGRKKAMVHFLEHNTVYQTEAFKAAYETKARENIQKEITSLN